MYVICVANHKGGVTKSATTEHLGWLFANRHNLRVLLIDMDPQGSLTEALGVADAEGSSMAEVLGGSDRPSKRIKQIIRDLGNGLYLAPADIAMARSEHAIASRPLGRELVLTQELQTIKRDYDIGLIDCPPSLGQLTFNALFASEGVIIPTGPTAKDLRGLRLFRETMDEIRPYHDIREIGVLLALYQSNINLHQRVKAELEAADAAGALHLFRTTIGKSVKVSEAEEMGYTLFEHEPHNPRVAEYEALAKEVLGCLSNERVA